MLVLTRRINERIKIGNDIELVITEVKQDVVKIGINAPKDISIYRAEVYEAIKQANQDSALDPATLGTMTGIFSEIVDKK